jgi:hypothetical protein
MYSSKSIAGVVTEANADFAKAVQLANYVTTGVDGSANGEVTSFFANFATQ